VEGTAAVRASVKDAADAEVLNLGSAMYCQSVCYNALLTETTANAMTQCCTQCVMLWKHTEERW